MKAVLISRGKWMRQLTKIETLDNKQPLFLEFCKVKGLIVGDYYSAVDYLEYCDNLTIEQQLGIIRKYIPNFMLEGCNL